VLTVTMLVLGSIPMLLRRTAANRGGGGH
jgi:hypothetical protein